MNINLKKIKIIALFPLLVFIGVTSCVGKADKVKGKIVISGTVKNPIVGKIILQEIFENGATGQEQEILLTSDNKFRKVVAVKNPGYYRIDFFKARQALLILAESDLEITVDCASRKAEEENNNVVIKGSPEHDLLHEVKNIFEPKNNLELNNLEKQYRQAEQEGNTQKMKEAEQQWRTITDSGTQAVADFVRKRPTTFATIYLLQTYFKDKNSFRDLYDRAATDLSKKYPASPQVKLFAEMVRREKRLAIGQPAPEISLASPAGKTIPLSSLRGKYVLLDFWASWCGPCRRENPNVLAVYNKYKPKGFEVFAVSLDREKEAWVKAIAQDGLTYTHVSDLKYFDSEAALTYNVEGIPMCYLIDPKGKIMAKNLRGPQLEELLENTFK